MVFHVDELVKANVDLTAHTSQFRRQSLTLGHYIHLQMKHWPSILMQHHCKQLFDMVY
jgi:hypothetical protein